MKPLMPSPGSPKIVSTPQSISRSTSRSDAVLGMVWGPPGEWEPVQADGYPDPGAGEPECHRADKACAEERTYAGALPWRGGEELWCASFETISTSRLLALMLAVVVVGAGTAAIALAAGGGGGARPQPKPLAVAIHDALAAPSVDGVTARIKFTDHLVDSSAIPGATPLLSGASGRAWASSDGRVRLELQSDSGDVQLVSDGHSFLVYDGSSNTAYRGRFPQAARPRRQREARGATVRGRDHEVARPGAARAGAERRHSHHRRGAARLPGARAAAPRGLVSGAALAWDAVHGVPLSLAVYARGNGSPVLALTAHEHLVRRGSRLHVRDRPAQGREVVNSTWEAGRRRLAKRPRFAGWRPSAGRAVQAGRPARLAGRARAR